MISVEKLPNNGGDLGKFIIAKGFKSCPKSNKSPNLVTLMKSQRFISLANSDHHNGHKNYHRPQSSILKGVDTFKPPLLSSQQIKC